MPPGVDDGEPAPRPVFGDIAQNLGEEGILGDGRRGSGAFGLAVVVTQEATDGQLRCCSGAEQHVARPSAGELDLALSGS